MSDDELSDGMQELNQLIAECRDKEDEQKKENNDKDVKSDCEKSEGVPMDKVLFGDKAKLIKNLKKAVSTVSKQQDSENEKHETHAEKDEEEKGSAKNKKSKKRKPVWTDADDEDIQLGEIRRETKRTGPLDHLKKDKSYKEYLTSRFTRIVNQPKWASLDKTKKEENDGNEDDDELLRTVGFLNKPSESILTPEHLKVKRMKDLNQATYAEGCINSIQFHPTSTAALVAGNKGVVTIYAIDGVQNDKLHNIHISNFPIRCAKILPCGTKAIFGSNRWQAYLYDLMSAKETCFKLKRDYGNLSNFVVSPCGRYLTSAGLSGEIHIYEAKTFEIIRSFKQNENVASMCFTADSQRLLVNGRSSNVCVFSMRQQRLEHKFIDDGFIVGSCMDLSPNQRLLATGSMEGVVNVYDYDKVMLSPTPQPEKTFLHLTTGITNVQFNHSSELLAFSSNQCENAIKIAHFPTATVYSNFPGKMPKFGLVRTLEFSPHSAYLALGSTEKCPLLRIKHFQNY